MSDYKGVPTLMARRVAEETASDQVIIIAWNGNQRVQWVTTYGQTKADSLQAASAGNQLRRALGWPEYLCHERPAWWAMERAALLEACKIALAEMQNTDAALEAEAEAKGKLGSYNPFFAKEIRLLKEVIAGAETEKE